MSIGEMIKKRRKVLNYTQKELAENICTQAMISKIESGEFEPNGKLLDKIATKLRVSVSYFYGEQSTYSQDDHLKQLKKIIYSELSQMNSDQVQLLLNSNKDVIKLAVALEDIYFFEWVKGCLSFYSHYDSDEALTRLKAIPVDEIENTDLAIEILNSIASIYTHTEQYDQALEYYEKVNFMNQSKISIETKAKFLFNFAYCLKEKGM